MFELQQKISIFMLSYKAIAKINFASLPKLFPNNLQYFQAIVFSGRLNKCTKKSQDVM